VLVHLSAGTLNPAVTLAAAFTPNTHPPNVVLGDFTQVTQFAVDAERAEDGRCQRWILPAILAQKPIRVTSSTIAVGTAAIAAVRL